ncbi:hypothetical protein V8D89_004199 [Ganoderma adspersum]
MPPANSRHRHWAPCDVLRANHISYVHWYEDALRRYGSKTIIFFLYLLVESVQNAETCLQSAGWTHTSLPPNSPQYYDPDVDDTAVLGLGDDLEAVVVLMPIHPWPGVSFSQSGDGDDRGVTDVDDRDVANADTNERGDADDGGEGDATASDHSNVDASDADDAKLKMHVDAHANADDGYPSLPQLFNALAQRSLDTECDPFRRYLNIQLAYLYMDCPELASPGFLSTLPVDIRQYHLDRLSDTLRMQAPKTIEHERDVRERARKGDWVLMYQGSAEVGGLKIDREYEARLLAKLTLSAAAAAAARVAAATQRGSLDD